LISHHIIEAVVVVGQGEGEVRVKEVVVISKLGLHLLGLWTESKRTVLGRGIRRGRVLVEGALAGERRGCVVVVKRVDHRFGFLELLAHRLKHQLRLLLSLGESEDGFSNLTIGNGFVGLEGGQNGNNLLGLVSLDLLGLATTDLAEHVLLVADEGGMRKLKSFTLRGVDLVEAIGVQLANKGAKVVVLEVLREDVLLKRVRVPDGEGGAILRPRYDVVGGVVRDKLESLANKGRGGVHN